MGGEARVKPEPAARSDKFVYVTLVKLEAILLKLLEFLQAYNGAFYLLATLVLIIITGYYAKQTKKQVDAAQEIILEAKKRSEGEFQKLQNLKKNYAFLVNAEIAINSNFFVLMLYGFKKGSETDKKEIKDLARGLVTDNVWASINIQMAEHFSSELMQELVGYYYGINSVKLYDPKKRTDESLIELSKLQLLDAIKCILLIEQETCQKLRIQEVWDFDNQKVKVNPENGDIIIFNQ